LASLILELEKWYPKLLIQKMVCSSKNTIRSCHSFFAKTSEGYIWLLFDISSTSQVSVIWYKKMSIASVFRCKTKLSLPRVMKKYFYVLCQTFVFYFVEFWHFDIPILFWWILAFWFHYSYLNLTSMHFLWVEFLYKDKQLVLI